MGELTETEQQILDLERGWWKYPGAKDAAIRDQFGITPTRYYQRLNQLIDQPQADAYDPLLVRRLRRLRAARQWQRDRRRIEPGA